MRKKEAERLATRVVACKLELMSELKKQKKNIEKVISELTKGNTNLWGPINDTGVIAADLMYVWKTVGNRVPLEVK